MIKIIQYPDKICPFCGETKRHYEYPKSRFFKKGLKVIQEKYLFNEKKIMQCYTCGAKWEC